MEHHQDTGTEATADLADGTTARIVLSIPALPEYVALSRLAIATLATRFELDQETASDLKLAVTEACSLFIGEAGDTADPNGIRVEFRLGEEQWSISVTGVVGAGGLDGGDHSAGLALVVIQALTDEVDTRQEGSRGWLRFSKSIR